MAGRLSPQESPAIFIFMTIEVIIPSSFNPAWHASSSCAIEGNQFAVDALETIRRVKFGDAIGIVYAERLNEFMRRQSGR